MSFLTNKLFGMLGNESSNLPSQNQQSSISGAETIESLCDRVQSSSLIEDRRESLDTIKSLSKRFKLEVGTQAMPLLIDILKNSRMDTELCNIALDILYNIVTTDKTNELEQKNLPADITNQFTEMFVKDQQNVVIIFELLEDFTFQTRWSAVKLLNAFILNQPQKLQDAVLQVPRGVSILMDLMTDSREVIRNDIILLLSNLVHQNSNLQKIIAFESGFDRILEIISSEGAVEGGIVVEDCFNLLLDLLEMNSSNLNFFKEANYIKTLVKYFDLSSPPPMGPNVTATTHTDDNSMSNAINTSPASWTVQKSTNLSLLFRLIRALVSPSNQHQIIVDCQKSINNCGLLHRLCAILMLPGVPAELLSDAISTVGYVIRGNLTNQQLFSAVMMQSSPPKPIIIILLMSMINERQPFLLRCSILYCFQSLLHKNEKIQAEVVKTLLPQEHAQQQNDITTGQLLCSGLFNPNDFVSNWLSAIAIAHAINSNTAQKEQLLRVQLSLDSSSSPQPISLLQQCMLTLNNQSQSARLNKFPSIVSLLMLLSEWLANCPSAVNYFLSQETNISYLVSQVSSAETEEKSLIIQGLNAFVLGLCMLFNTNQVKGMTVDSLKDTIKKRVGIEQFKTKLEFISQHESYMKTLKKPTSTFKHKSPEDLLFDYEFTRLFKSNETLIVNLLDNKMGSNMLMMQSNNNQHTRNLSDFSNDSNHSHSKTPYAYSDMDNQNYPANGQSNNYYQPSQPQMYQPISQQSKYESLEQYSAVISQFQQYIREQDVKLKEQIKLNETLVQTCNQLREENEALKKKSAENSQTTDSRYEETKRQLDLLMVERLQMVSKINEYEVIANLLEEKCSEQEDELSRLRRENGILHETIANANADEEVSVNTNSNEVSSNIVHNDSVSTDSARLSVDKTRPAAHADLNGLSDTYPITSASPIYQPNHANTAHCTYEKNGSSYPIASTDSNFLTEVSRSNDPYSNNLAGLQKPIQINSSNINGLPNDSYGLPSAITNPTESYPSAASLFSNMSQQTDKFTNLTLND